MNSHKSRSPFYPDSAMIVGPQWYGVDLVLKLLLSIKGAP
jgi:hypothetical protein